MEVRNIRLAMGQMLVEGGKAAENLQRAERMIQKAADQNCEIIVLPECMDLGWTYPGAKELAQPIPGSHSDFLCRCAREYGIYITAGLTEKAGDRIYNAALLISPEGEILLKHRKINVLNIAQDLYSIGNSLSVAETPLGTIGLTICADNFRDSLVFAHSLGRMGARLLLSPSAWAVDADHDNSAYPYGGDWENSYREIAASYDMTVVGVSNVGWIKDGVWKGRKCIGCSLAVGPGGQVLKKGPYGEMAESLIIVPVTLFPSFPKGTDISVALRKKNKA